MFLHCTYKCDKVIGVIGKKFMNMCSALGVVATERLVQYEQFCPSLPKSDLDSVCKMYSDRPQ